MSNRETLQFGQKHGNIKESSLGNGTQRKVRCLESETSIEESWLLDKAMSNQNLKKISLQIDRRETATDEGKRFLETQESLFSPNSEKNQVSRPLGSTTSGLRV